MSEEAAMTKITIITSSKYLTQMDLAFKAGLSEGGYPGSIVDPAVELDGKYDDAGTKTDLNKAMTDADGKTDLIIAVGGLASAHAANKELKTTPFLIAIGQDPKFDLDNSKFCGGVNLGMVSQNIARHNFLVDHYVVPKDKVCLIWNSNSKMGKYEKKEWSRHTNWPDISVDNNTESDITNAFADAADPKKKNCQAAVISGDPYFTAHMDAVVKAATASKMKICYPFRLYLNANPTSKYSMIYGPDLELAYRLLGSKAALVLDSLKDPLDTGLDPCPSTGPTYIGG
jgi:hypothetical protein